MSNFFSAHEVNDDKRLQGIYWLLVLGMSFALSENYVSRVFTPSNDPSGDPSCPIYFQSCKKFDLLETVPVGYSFAIFLAVVFGLLAYSVYSASQKKWPTALLFLSFPFAVSASLNYLFSDRPSIPITGYLFFPCFIFLFSKRKFANLSLLAVAMYSMAGIVKLHEGWIAGTYFSALRLGLPIFPRQMIPLATNLVIIMELSMSWFLLFEGNRLKKLALSFFIAFHLYSFIIVGAFYPLRALPLLMLLFWGNHKFEKKCSVLGVGFVCVLFLLNIRPFFYWGDSKITFEGTELAFVMFDGNRQTVSNTKYIYADGTSKTVLVGIDNAFIRLRPYSVWYRVQLDCGRPGLQRIEWTMDQSLNGGPFRRIVDEKNACDLQFNVTHHNQWIHPDGPVMGYPDYNYYFGASDFSNRLGGPRTAGLVSPTPIIVPTPMEEFFKGKASFLQWLYAVLAILSPLYVLSKIRRTALPRHS